ncbi:MAG: sugar transferase [Chloroflexota bacterium]|nr:sugar transferase [Chloroflexota bacterium]
MIRRYSTALRLALVLADGMSAAAVFVLLSVARFGDAWRSTWGQADIDPGVAAVAFGIAWPAALWLGGLYRLRSRWTFRGELTDFVRAGVILAVVSLATLFLVKLPDVSRSFLLLLFPTQVAVTLVSRFALRRLFAWMRARGMNTRYMLVVGTSRSAIAFAARVERHPDLGLKVIGHLALETNGPFAGLRPVLGTVDDIQEILHTRIIDEVAICLPPASLALVEPIVRLCEEEGRIVRLPLDDLGITLTGGRIEEFDSVPVMSFAHGPDRALGLLVKRLFDIALSGAAIIVLSPLLIGISLAIFVADGRPILFRQTRMGVQGRPFKVLKFRTMVRDAEARLVELEGLNEINGHAFKVTFDPRLSRIGGWLRRASLDELPQLWNVLRGEMSIVGPRPPLPREVAGYDIWHRRRLSMKPGMTGLWQVSARREADFDRWVAIDLEYIDQWSLWLDLKIIARTIPAVVMHQGR